MAQFIPPDNFIQTESAVPGIAVYMPAPAETGPHPEVVDFKCPQCGATTAFSAAEGGLTCSHCGYYEPPQKTAIGKGAATFEFTVETMQRAAQNGERDRKELICQNCGANTSVPAEALTHTCPFCGSNKVIQRAAPQDILRPRYLIPFKIEASACRDLAIQWLGSHWMAPGGLQRVANLANFTGIYLPFWTFDSMALAAWKAEVGHTKTERYYQNGEWKTRTKTEWRWESGRVQLRFENLLVEGTTHISRLLLRRIKDFDLRELCPYEPKYLAGIQAQAYDVPLEQAWESGRSEMREQTRSACIKQASSSQIRNFSMNLDFQDESWRYILLPIYLATYPYEGKVYQVLINGQSGEISGQRPVDWRKVWLAVAASLAPGLLLGIIGLLTIILGGMGMVVGGAGFLLLVIGLVIAILIIRHAQGMDDA